VYGTVPTAAYHFDLARRTTPHRLPLHQGAGG
jgi:hypothetical protein